LLNILYVSQGSEAIHLMYQYIRLLFLFVNKYQKLSEIIPRFNVFVGIIIL